MIDMMLAAWRLEHNKASQDDIIKLSGFQRSSGPEKTFGYHVIDKLAPLPALAIETMLTGGYPVGKKVVLALGRRTLTRVLDKKAKRALNSRTLQLAGKIARGIGGTAVQTVVTEPEAIIKNSLEKTIPEVSVKIDRQGRITGVKTKSGEPLPKALREEFAKKWVETCADHSGGLLREAARTRTARELKDGILRVIIRANPGIRPETLQKIADSGVFRGTGEEMFKILLKQTGLALLEGKDYTFPGYQELLAEFVAGSTKKGAGKIYKDWKSNRSSGTSETGGAIPGESEVRQGSKDR
jgi:hypothetical protein